MTTCLSNYASLNITDHISRIYGVGDITLVGQREYSMRLSVSPDKLASLGLRRATSSMRCATRTSRRRPARWASRPPSRASAARKP